MTRTETLGDRIRRLRSERGLTQKDLAEPRYTAAYVSTIEAGRRQPSPATIEHFAIGLKVDIDELRTGRPSGLVPEMRLELETARDRVYAGDIEGARAGFKQVQKKARKHAVPHVLAKAEEGLGLIARRDGLGADSLAHYEIALDLLQEDPPPARADAIVGVARAHRMLGDTRLSAHILETYLRELEGAGLGDPLALMLTHAALVTTYFSLGMFEQAADAGDEAMKLAPKVEDVHEVANMHINVAQVFMHQERWDDALRSLDRAKETYATLEWQNEVARALTARAIVLRAAGRLDDARKVLRDATDLLREAPSRLEEARVLNELAHVERLSGNLEEAKKLLERSLPMLHESDVLERAFCERELALCIGATDRAGAEKHLRKALELYGRAEHAKETAATFKELGDLYHSQGDLEQTCAAYASAIDAALSA